MATPSETPSPVVPYSDRIKTFCNLTPQDVVNGKRITWFDDVANKLFNSCARVQVSAHSLPEPGTLYDLLKDIDVVHADPAVTLGLAKKVLTWIRGHVNEIYLSPAMEEVPDSPGTRGSTYTVQWREYTLNWKADFALIKQGPTPSQGAGMAWREPVKRPYTTISMCVNQLESFLKHKQGPPGDKTSVESSIHSSEIADLRQQIDQLKAEGQQASHVRKAAHDQLIHTSKQVQHLEKELKMVQQKEANTRKELEDIIHQIKQAHQADRNTIVVLEKSLESANATIAALQHHPGPRSPPLTPERASPHFPVHPSDIYNLSSSPTYRYVAHPTYFHPKSQHPRARVGYSYGGDDVYELPEVADVSLASTQKYPPAKVAAAPQSGHRAAETKEESLRRLYGNRK